MFKKIILNVITTLINSNFDILDLNIIKEFSSSLAVLGVIKQKAGYD